MEAFRTKGRAENGKLVVGIPREFDKKTLEVIVLKEDDDKEFKAKDNQEQRMQRMMKIVGSAKNPEFPITKYDVYDQ